MVRIRSLLDNLAIAISLIGALPVYLYLDRPTQVIFPLALLVGARCDRRGEHYLSARLATLVSLLVFTVYALQISKDNLVNPALNVAILLLSVRLLTEKEGRHFLQIFLLSGFALAGSSLLTLSLAFLPLMILLVTGIIGGLILLCFYSDDPRLTLDRAGFVRLIRIGLLLPAGSLLLAIFFFFILPRTQHPLWDFLNPGGTIKVGFSEEVRPGAFASTVADDTIAFRVEAPEMDPNELYWRVTVLDSLEGPVWKRTTPAAIGDPDVSGGREVDLTIFPEAGQGEFLVTLDRPQTISGVYKRHWTDGTFRYYRSTKRPQSYQVKARINGELRAGRKLDRQTYLALPTGLAPRTRALTRDLLTSAGRDTAARLASIKAFFRDRQLIYATDNLPITDSPIDTFLFETRRGYCEYFASAFAVMLREAGIPSRLVGGYLGGLYNPLGSYYIVGEKNAHVWVEALTDNGTWERIDPNLYAANAGSSLLARSLQQRAAWAQWADAIDYFWIQTVITLDFARQLELAREARDKIRDWRQQEFQWREKAWLVVVVLGTAVLFMAGRRKRVSVEEELLGRFTRLVRQQAGAISLPPSAGITELARLANDQSAMEFARIYGKAIYRDRKLHPEEIATLRQLLRTMRKSPEAAGR